MALSTRSSLIRPLAGHILYIVMVFIDNEAINMETVSSQVEGVARPSFAPTVVAHFKTDYYLWMKHFDSEEQTVHSF